MDQNTNRIHFTESALMRIQRLLSRSEKQDQVLRIYIVGGGCSGFQYGFNLEDPISSEEDILIERPLSDGLLKIVIDSLSMQYLEGSTVDFLENLQGARFVVNNPHAETTCGCGSSFSLKEE